jgi:hypothetical protein
MEESTESKQAFLRVTILDKNYDPEDFLNYLISLKGNFAGNVEIWTLEELKKVVNTYIEMKTSKNDTLGEASTNEYNEIITCKKQEKSQLSETNNIIVTVNEYTYII